MSDESQHQVSGVCWAQSGVGGGEGTTHTPVSGGNGEAKHV